MADVGDRTFLLLDFGMFYTCHCKGGHLSHRHGRGFASPSWVESKILDLEWAGSGKFMDSYTEN